MSGSSLSRSPTCLACLRRLAIGNSGPSATTSAIWLQTRGKTHHARPTDRGVLVRLLEDIPKFGRKHAIFRVDRGRMRNLWYHRKQAEYMTTARFQELGLTKDDIGERDFLFGTLSAESEDAEAVAAMEAELPRAEVKLLTPEDTRIFITTLVPEILTFYGKLIDPQAAAPPAPEPEPIEKPHSPLIAQAPPSEAEPESASAKEPLAIFGSVSTKEIANKIKRALSVDHEASRVVLEAHDLRFVDLPQGVDRVKTLGRWEVEISVGDGEEPIRRLVEVLPEEE